MKSYILPTVALTTTFVLFWLLQKAQTVGYGDLTLTTDAGKLFTCIFGLGGVVFLGAAVASIGSTVVLAVEQEALERLQHEKRQQVLQVFETNSSSCTGIDNEEDDPSKMMTTATATLWRQTWAETAWKFVPAFGFLLSGGLVMGALEGWSLVDCLYYCVTTGATIGFGDVAPVTEWGRLWAIPFVPLSVAAAGEVLSNVAFAVLANRQKDVYKYLSEQDVTIEYLMSMDADHNGRVDREEYVNCMLLEMKLVNEKQLEELHAQFDRLDVTRSGFLNQDDLKLMAEQRKERQQQRF